MSFDKRRILVTAALPYANGDIHVGNLVTYIQTDIWVRFQRMRGHEVYFVCGDDTHGTPIMLRAKSEGITPEVLIERVLDEHKRDFETFSISFDNYYTTHSPENKECSETIYNAANAKGHIARREIQQAYDRLRQSGFPFDQGIRLALNHGTYRLLPMLDSDRETLDQIINDAAGLLDAGWPTGDHRHPRPRVGHGALAAGGLRTVPRGEDRFSLISSFCSGRCRLRLQT